MKLKKFRIPIFLFLISLFLNIYGIWWGLPNYFTWSIDDLTPTQPLLIANNFLKVNSQYPIFHYVLSGIFYSPYLSYLYLTGGLVNPHRGFPYGFTDPLTSLTVLLVISRLITALMGSLSVVFVYLSVKTLYGKIAGFFSALSVCFSYIFIMYSHLGNLDIPYVFWFTITLYFYARLLRTYNTKYYIFLGVFSALSICTKDQIMGFFIFLPVALLTLHFKHHSKILSIKQILLSKKLIYCLLAFMLTYLIFNNVLIDFDGYMYRINLFASGEAVDKDRYAQFPSTFLGQVQLFQEFVFQLKDSVGIGLFFLFLIGFFYCIYKFNDYTFAFLIPSISYYIFCIGRLYFMWHRMSIPIIIILSFFAGKFLSDLVKNVNVKKTIYPIIILIFVYSFLYGFSADLTLVYDSRYSAEDWMVKNIEKDAQIEVFGHQQYLPRFTALGFKNVSRLFFSYKGTEPPPEMLFKPIIDSPTLKSLKARNPDYIILPKCCYEEIEHILPLDLESKKVDLEMIEKDRAEIRNYIRLLLSEKAGYKIVKIFDNKIPFASEPHFVEKRMNLPVIILKRED